MIKMWTIGIVTSVLMLFNLTAMASTLPRICLVLDKGGKDDKSFNQSAYEGFLKAQKDFKLAPNSKYVTVREDAQGTQFIREFSAGNCSLIIAIGFNNADIVGQVSKQFPNQNFAVVDSPTKGDRIQAITFQEHEGGFLMGAIAAMKSKSEQVGFIGGMEIPLIKRFALGFEAGAKYINPKIKVYQSYVGVTSSSWNNPSKAKELATAMYEQHNVDIIFVAAGASSQGVFDAVQQIKTPNKYVIGVDSNQNYIVPGKVLTSLEKKVDLEVYNSIQSVVLGKFSPGVMTYGLQDGGIDWAFDKYNKALFTKHDITTINTIKKNILENKISVPDYYKLNGGK